MSGFTVSPGALRAHARRRDDDAEVLDRLSRRVRRAQGDDLALGAVCATAYGGIRDALDAAGELVHTLGHSSRVLATALREGADDHVATDDEVARTFGSRA